MIFLLLGVVGILLAVIFFLISDIRKSRASHQKKVVLFQEMIVHLLDNHDIQNDKIKISDELKEKLQNANHTLSTDIGSLIHDFVETLSQNNLLKK